METKQNIYNDFSGGQYDGISQTITIDSIGYNSITVYNTSLAGTIFILPNTQLEPGQSVTYKGNELENFTGKIQIFLTNFFANIEYGYCVIRKKYIN